MLAPPSLVHEYTLVYSGDPALAAPSDDATEEERAAWPGRLERARETGQWSPVLKPGQEPSLFVMRQFTGSQRRELMDWMMRPGGNLLRTSQLFRAALLEVRNLGDAKVTRAVDLDSGISFPIAAAAVADLLDSLDLAIVAELGALVYERVIRGPSPKS